ncbi:MAG: hypothetical protein ABEJ64_02810 [Candidatus Nanohaloarchaea archaeon]
MEGEQDSGREEASESITAVIPFLERDGENSDRYNEDVALENAGRALEEAESGTVDELLFIDGSDPEGELSRELREIAGSSGIARYRNESSPGFQGEVRQETGVEPGQLPPGKGSALFQASAVAGGDSLVFLDSDVTTTVDDRVDESIATYMRDLASAIDGDTMFAKGDLNRYDSFEVDGEEGQMYGGRVTRATRALFDLYSRAEMDTEGIESLQQFGYPLSGEFAVDRELFLDMETWPGYGLEMGMLVQVVDRLDPESIENVDLGYHSHISHDSDGAGEIARDVFGALKQSMERYWGVDAERPLGDTTVWRDADWEEPVDRFLDELERSMAKVYREELRDGDIEPGVYWPAETVTRLMVEGEAGSQPINAGYVDSGTPQVVPSED